MMNNLKWYENEELDGCSRSSCIKGTEREYIRCPLNSLGRVFLRALQRAGMQWLRCRLCSRLRWIPSLGHSFRPGKSLSHLLSALRPVGGKGTVFGKHRKRSEVCPRSTADVERQSFDITNESRLEFPNGQFIEMDMNIRGVECLNVKTNFSTRVIRVGDLTNEFAVWWKDRLEPYMSTWGYLPHPVYWCRTQSLLLKRSRWWMSSSVRTIFENAGKL